MEDSAGPHSHHFLAGSRDIEKIEQEKWPSLSPDFNTIEILWTGMKDSIATCKPKITKVKEFKLVLVEE